MSSSNEYESVWELTSFDEYESDSESQPAVPTPTKHSFSSKRTAPAVADADEVPPSCRPPASKVSRKDGGDRVSILSLPGAIVERLFELLDVGSRERKFPPRADGGPDGPARNVRNFAFSCSQFSQVFRESYVRESSVSDILRTPEDALVYHEAVREALRRFRSAEKLTFSRINCVSWKIFDFRRKLGCEQNVNLSELTEKFQGYCRSAVAARKSMVGPVVCGSEWDFGTKVTEIVFDWETDYNRYSGDIECGGSPGAMAEVRTVWNWETELHWLVGSLPNMKAAVFNDLPAFSRAAALCGPSHVGLKNDIIILLRV